MVDLSRVHGRRDRHRDRLGVATAADLLRRRARSGIAFRAITTTAVAFGAFLAVVAVYAILTARGRDPERCSCGRDGASAHLDVSRPAPAPAAALPRRGPWATAAGRSRSPSSPRCSCSAGCRARHREPHDLARVRHGFSCSPRCSRPALARPAQARVPRRWTAVLLASLVVVAVLFVDAAMRAKTDHRADTTVAQAIRTIRASFSGSTRSSG